MFARLEGQHQTQTTYRIQPVTSRGPHGIRQDYSITKGHDRLDRGTGASGYPSKDGHVLPAVAWSDQTERVIPSKIGILVRGFDILSAQRLIEYWLIQRGSGRSFGGQRGRLCRCVSFALSGRTESEFVSISSILLCRRLTRHVPILTSFRLAVPAA